MLHISLFKVRFLHDTRVFGLIKKPDVGYIKSLWPIFK